MLFEELVVALDAEPHSAPLNMALDEALLQRAQLPTLRVYRWCAPAVSFGYFGKFAEAEVVAAGREMVRRWTGGGLVEHGTDITYTLVVPRDAAFFRQIPLESYRLIHEPIARWLLAQGVDAAVANGAAEERSAACFASHVRYDVVASGAKLAGAAQRRTRWGLLHQGSIQRVDGKRGPLGIDRQNASAGSLSPTALTEFAQCFTDGVRLSEIPAEVQDTAEQIAWEKYATDGWMHRR